VTKKIEKAAKDEITLNTNRDNYKASELPPSPLASQRELSGSFAYSALETKELSN
jgi:hypothetical protein